ncbi:hypothetical protein [Azospirillum sp.]|uniref:hypothetical protein n=1 Tax=Azospirillum sp. TaxID=34012 RepID=UPI002D2422B5|nr:hypothetical protein [Azospirillum sp.]HYF87501.1 hypothetical protein [Azospirillum sp.]
MPLDSRTLSDDHFPCWAEEPPVPAGGSLVPRSQFHEEQWIMAAGMLARGSSFLYVARAMGCSRTTLWRAYYGSRDFRHRVWWERQALNREADLRLSSIRTLVAEQIERLVSMGDPKTVRWLAERLGLFAGLDAPARPAARAPQPDRPAPSPEPAATPAPQSPPQPEPAAPPPTPAGPGGDRPRPRPVEPVAAALPDPAPAPVDGWNSARNPFHTVPSAAAPPAKAGGRRRVIPLGSGRNTSAPSPSGSALAS